MKNELEESWNKHKKQHPHFADLHRDRTNFQAGFNAAFKLFGKTKAKCTGCTITDVKEDCPIHIPLLGKEEDENKVSL